MISIKTIMIVAPFFTALMYGIAYALYERIFHQVGIASFYVYLGIAICLTGLVWAWNNNELGRLTLPFSKRDITFLFFLALFFSIAPRVLSDLTIQHVSATYAAIGEVTYPIFVPIFAYLFFREKQWDWPTIVGGCLIMLGLFIMIYWRSRIQQGGA